MIPHNKAYYNKLLIYYRLGTKQLMHLLVGKNRVIRMLYNGYNSIINYCNLIESIVKFDCTYHTLYTHSLITSKSKHS